MSSLKKPFDETASYYSHWILALLLVDSMDVVFQQPGSNGGGAIILTAQNLIQVDGLIDVSAAPAINKGSGGGSGGSIFLKSAQFHGKGKLQANGGQVSQASFGDGGGGAGGRVALHYGSSRYSGALTAHGGLSRTESGGAGTIYQAKNETERVLIVDNNGVKPASLYITNYRNIDDDGGRTWVMMDYHTVSRQLKQLGR